MTGASLEVLRHHAREHERTSPDCVNSTCSDRPCPCGDSIALICGVCEEPVFLVCRPGTFCQHAQENSAGRS